MVLVLKKKAMAAMKLNLLIFVIMLGLFLPCMKASAASTEIYSYITEFSVNDTTWKYGDAAATSVASYQEPVSVKYTLYFTKTQWEELYQNGKVSLNWKLPEGIDITHVEQDVIASMDGNEQSIGTMQVINSQVELTIKEECAEVIAHSDNIEITMGVTLQFDEGTYNLGDMIIVESSEAGHASARWNNYTVQINKIDENRDSKLLDGAYFEIDEYHYSEDAYAYKGHEIFSLPENHVEENGTYILEGAGFTTIEDKKTVLEGGFEPGELYVLKELRAPVGYLPAEEAVKIAFYRYTDSDKEGTINKIRELNASYKERYENEGAVAVFGSEEGTMDTQEHNIYVKNKKVPQLQVLKLDAMTGEVISGVEFTLQLDAQKADYTVDQYTNLENSGWEYNTATGKLTWTMKTDGNGIISYPAGTVPYSSNGYQLIETVPEGYEGHGGTKTTSFKMNPNGSVEITDGLGIIDAVNGVITVKIENDRVANVEILKVDDSENTLEGAVFAVYGTVKKDTEDVLKKGGKEYYYIEEKTTGTDGKVVFSNLPYGEYYLVEKQAPEGYKILEDSYRVELSEDTLENGVCAVKIINTKKGAQIVATGGKGIAPYIAVSAVLLVLGSLFFIASQKKKKRKKARRRAQAARRKNAGNVRNGR